MVTRVSPTVVQRFVAFELRRLRDAAGLKTPAVGERVGCAASRITQFETLHSLPSMAQLELMLTMYGVPDRITPFRELLSSARKGTDWWLDQFQGATPEWFDLYLGMESMATRIASYQNVAVLGLFQTEDYARTLIEIGQPTLTDDEVSRKVDLRMARQDILTRDADPPHVWAVMDETVFLRPVGSPAIMREQIDRLIALTELPNITIQLLPLSAGMHVGMDGEFQIFDFPPEMVDDPGVAYTQTCANATYHENRHDLQQFRDTHTTLQIQAHDTKETLQNLSAIRERYT